MVQPYLDNVAFRISPKLFFSLETVTLSNPTAACGDAVYECVKEDQVRQATIESSHDVNQDNAAYGITV